MRPSYFSTLLLPSVVRVRIAIPRHCSMALFSASSSSSSGSAFLQKSLAPALSPSWEEGAPFARAFVPSLTRDMHKGSAGRVAVMGGSKEYTGAPFYAATTALKAGADLAFILCAEEAATPIKCYGPELMVVPVYSSLEFSRFDGNLGRASSSKTSVSMAIPGEAETLLQDSFAKVKEALDRAHTLLLGPGFGRQPLALELAARTIGYALHQRRMPVVIDADGLFLVTERPDVIVSAGSSSDATDTRSNLLLTPNAAEFRRLRDALLYKGNRNACTGHEGEVEASEAKMNVDEQLKAMSNNLGGAVILLKGAVDTVSDGHRILRMVHENGSPRRCGGQGDITSGAAAIFLHWALQINSSSRTKNVEVWRRHAAPKRLPEECQSNTTHPALADCNGAMWAAWAAAALTKRCAAQAFGKHRRSTTAPDLIEEIRTVGDFMFPLVEETEVGTSGEI